MNAKEMVQSKYFKSVAIVVGMLIIALASFVSGVAVGIHKAKFSYAFGENYERNFVGGPRGMMAGARGGMLERFGFDGRFDGRDFRNAHGIAGRVISVSDNSLIINDKNNKENTVAVTEKTILKRSGENVKLSDIVKGDNVVVIGSPSESGVISADLIRIFSQEANNQ
ncbi:MAG: hypothetical protein WAV46_01055 [Candidatus Moraniibacteriota bacterium]